MNLRILHYSFINHHFHHSTITIKQKIIINKLVTDRYFEVIFCEKIVVRMKNVKFRGFTAKKTNSAAIPRLKFRGENPNSAVRLENSAGRGKLWALVIIRGVNPGRLEIYRDPRFWAVCRPWGRRGSWTGREILGLLYVLSCMYRKYDVQTSKVVA